MDAQPLSTWALMLLSSSWFPYIPLAVLVPGRVVWLPVSLTAVVDRDKIMNSLGAPQAATGDARQNACFGVIPERRQTK